MYNVRVFVSYKSSVLDPQGEAIKGAVHRLGYQEVTDIRMGKFFDMQVQKADRPIEETIEAICDQLLANINMETYTYEIQEAVQ